MGFDFLRDHLALTPEQTVLPNAGGEFDGFCLVDEADSVLIDEARTPLIISKQVPAPANTRRGPCICTTACLCWELRPSSILGKVTA